MVFACNGADRQHPGVAVQVVAGDLAAGEEAHQRDVAQGPAHDLQLGTGAAEVRAAAAGAADVDGAGHAPRPGAGSGSAARAGHAQRRTPTSAVHFLGLEFFADLGADAHQVGARGLHVALAEGQAHARLHRARQWPRRGAPGPAR
jgi:hypothetical protein